MNVVGVKEKARELFMEFPDSVVVAIEADNTKEEETFTFTVINEKTRYALEVYKHEKGNPAKCLQGAQFAVTNSLGFTKVITTGADGIARLDNILYDDYTIREIKEAIAPIVTTFYCPLTAQVHDDEYGDMKKHKVYKYGKIEVTVYRAGNGDDEE